MRTIALQATAPTANPQRTGVFNPQAGTASDDFTHCEVCDKDIPSYRWGFHLTYAAHIGAQRLAATQAALNAAAQDKNGVTISGAVGGVDFGVIELESSVGPE